MSKFLYSLLFITQLFAIDTIKLPLAGVKIIDHNQSITIERTVDASCMNLTMNAKSFWGGDFASNIIPKPCKKSFVTTTGVIQPLYLHKDIETFAELEVLEYIKLKSSKEPQNYLLIDSRPSSWFEHSTIPSAINIPFDDLVIDNDFKEEYTQAYAQLGVKIQSGKFDFSQAKEIVIFCNGSWCTHSPRTIKTLLKVGYPPNKIKWYRGGVTSWASVGLTLIKK